MLELEYRHLVTSIAKSASKENINYFFMSSHHYKMEKSGNTLMRQPKLVSPMWTDEHHVALGMIEWVEKHQLYSILAENAYPLSNQEEMFKYKMRNILLKSTKEKGVGELTVLIQSFQFHKRQRNYVEIFQIKGG